MPMILICFEVNEAFAAVVLRYIDALGINNDIVNVNGGAIAMGHPLGATGAMLLGTLLDELERRNLSMDSYSVCRSRNGNGYNYRKSINWLQQLLIFVKKEK